MNSTPEPGQRDVRQRAFTSLAAQALLLVVASGLVVADVAFAAGPTALLLIALSLVLAAAIAWRARGSLATNLLESHAWTEVTEMRARLGQREALWSTLPAPAAAWDAQGQLVMLTRGWQAIGLPTEAPPTQQELSIGDPPRVFVVDSITDDAGTRLVLLREVSREREALQAKDELLAIVGHELRTPLSSIKGYGQLMSRQLATVQEQVQRLDQLIQDVLDTARVEGGRLTLRREAVYVDELVRSACERFRAANQSREVKQQLETQGVVEGDPARLSQVMDNLLSNAAKYSPLDSPISVHAYVDGDWARIAVTDRGVGIAAEHLPLLFDRFYRVPVKDASAPQGFGLGLSIVRDLVEAHGGQIEVASSGIGSGATFTISLPHCLSPESTPRGTSTGPESVRSTR